MANICNNDVTIMGKSHDVRKLLNRINKQDEELLKVFPFFNTDKYTDYRVYDLPTDIDKAEPLSFSFGSKWTAPLKELEAFCQLIKMDAKGSWEESACDVYGDFKYDSEAESFTYRELSPLEYYTEYHEDFAEERYFIETGHYEEVLDTYSKITEPDNDWDWFFQYLEALLLKRLKDKDLSIFINYPWNDIKAFRNRLEGLNA